MIYGIGPLTLNIVLALRHGSYASAFSKNQFNVLRTLQLKQSISTLSRIAPKGVTTESSATLKYIIAYCASFPGLKMPPLRKVTVSCNVTAESWLA